MKNRTIIYIICALMLVTGITTAVYLYQSNINSNNTKQSQQKESNKTDAKEITYKGKDGVTAMVLLKQNAKIETSKEGFVNSINGVKPDSSKKEFWAFYINDKSATEGAESYITKDTETITWKLESF